MTQLKMKFFALLREEEGLTTVEYAIAGSLVGLLVILAFTNLGTAVGEVITEICEEIGGTTC